MDGYGFKLDDLSANKKLTTNILVFISTKHVTPASIRCKIIFQNGCKIYSPSDDPIGYSKPPVAHGDLYPLICEIVSGNKNHIACSTESLEDPMVWHRRCCHIDARAVQKLFPYLTEPDLLAIGGCEACKSVKQTRDPKQRRTQPVRGLILEAIECGI